MPAMARSFLARSKSISSKTKTILVCGAVLSACFLLLEGMWRNSGRTTEDAERAAFVGSLRNLGTICLFYANEQGHLPDHWGRLLDTELVMPRDLKMFSYSFGRSNVLISKTESGYRVENSPYRILLPGRTTEGLEGGDGIVLGVFEDSEEAVFRTDGTVHFVHER